MPAPGADGTGKHGKGPGGVRGHCWLEAVLDTACHVHRACPISQPASRARTWGDEEGSPQLLVPRDIPDLPGHVDHPAGYRGHTAEVQDPAGRARGLICARGCPRGIEGICLSLPRALGPAWSAEDSALSPARVSSRCGSRTHTHTHTRWGSRELERGDPLDPVDDPKARPTNCPWGHGSSIPHGPTLAACPAPRSQGPRGAQRNPYAEEAAPRTGDPVGGRL